MLIQLCLASYLLFSGAYFSKPKLSEKWKWRLTRCPSYSFHSSGKIWGIKTWNLTGISDKMKTALRNILFNLAVNSFFFLSISVSHFLTISTLSTNDYYQNKLLHLLGKKGRKGGQIKIKDSSTSLLIGEL